jgi:hypothetical protein
MFAQYAAAAMLLWFENDGNEQRKGVKWATELQLRCQRVMRQALASERFQELLSDMDDGGFDFTDVDAVNNDTATDALDGQVPSLGSKRSSPGARQGAAQQPRRLPRSST